MTTDRIGLQIFADHSLAVAEAMANTLYRTAYSTFVKETEDFTTGLTTPEGLTYMSPNSFGSNWFAGLDYGGAIRLLDGYEEGDIALTNDPYSGFVCTHTPDLHLWKPVFHDGRIVSYAVCHVHNTDMGGAVPASLSRSLTEVYQEGIRFKPTRLFRKGQLDRGVVDVFTTNVRTPDQNWGDLKAMIAAVNTGEAKLKAMIDRFGIDAFEKGMNGLLDYSEQQARALIREIPNGSYFFAEYMDEDGPDGQPCRLACNMVVNDDDIVLDFSGSDPQTQSALNVPTGGNPRHTLLLVGIYFAFRTLKPDLLINTGLTRAFHSVIPEGSILNPVFPAAVGLRTLTTLRLQDVLFGCLVQALPNRLPAAPSGSVSIVNLKTQARDSSGIRMAVLEPVMGGGGAWGESDGQNGSGGNMGFLKNSPTEINEVEIPVLINRYHLTPDSGGAGKHRGGLGVELEFETITPNALVTVRNRDRTRFLAWGSMGGRAGGNSDFVVNAGLPNEIALGNRDVHACHPRDRIMVRSSGAGGYGAPHERPSERVAADVRAGFVTVAGAERDYGVVLSADGTVDVAATEKLRAVMAGSAGDKAFDYGAERDAFEAAWPAERYDAMMAEISRYPVEWRFFLKRKLFAANDPGDIVAQIRAIAAQERMPPPR